ncbi:MAG: ABC transporter ATP-binding protein [Myxococcales bacterium]|nr:ABC transporter ATP-binding protein [Myxococcales bacterium]
MSTTPPGPIQRFLRTYALRYLPVYLVGGAALFATNYINVLIPQFVKDTIDAVGQNQPSAEWVHYVVFIGLLAITVIVTRTLSRIMFFNPGRTIEFRLKNDYFRHLLAMAPAFFQRFRIGELISRGTNDMMSVRAIIGFATLQLINVVVALTLCIYQMIRLDVQLTLLCAIPLLASVWILRHGVGRLMTLFKEAQGQLSALSDTIMDAYTGATVIQTFHATDTFLGLFDKRNDDYIETYRKMTLIRALILPIVAVAGSICLVLLVFIGGHKVLSGAFSLGDIAAYAAYINIAVTSLNSSGWVVNSIQRGVVSLRRVYEILDAESDPVPSPPNPIPKPAPVSIEVRNLTFQYPETNDTARHSAALSDISFRIEAAQTLGIFGPTGSGKTTLVHLLTKLLTPPRNTVWINGKDILDWSREELRSLISVAPQDAYLFSRSIRENIGFWDLPKDISAEKLNESAQLACVEGEIRSLPEGLDTTVGERGITLSGGQRQRVALARAFYRDFGVLVLDDVLSAVDHHTERLLIDHIRRRSAQFTTIIVSNRISALQHADKILVLVDGKLSATGTHAQLLATSDVYTRTWEYQQQEQEEQPAELLPSWTTKEAAHG